LFFRWALEFCSSDAALTCRAALDVEVLDVEGVVFNELAAIFNVFTHQCGEDFIGFDSVLELDAEQSAVLWVHGGFPQLG
jgi:hypothetical protein